MKPSKRHRTPRKARLPNDQAAADCFRQKKSELLDRWVSAVQASLPAAGAHSRQDVIDHVPVVLDRLVESLSDFSCTMSAELHPAKLAREHGRQRSKLAGYDVEQVIEEYRILRRMLSEALLGFENPPSERARLLIHDFVDESIKHAVAEFTRITRRARLESEEQAQEALRLSRGQLDLALDAGNMAAWQVDLKTWKLTGSRRFADLHGLSRLSEDKDVFLHMDEMRIHPEDREELRRALTEVARNGTPYLHQFRVVRGDGSIRWLESKGQTTRDHAGEPDLFAGVTQDVTERMEAQLGAEHERERLYSSLMDAPVAIAVHRGLDLVTEFANALYLKVIGTTEDIRGKTLLEAIPSITPEIMALHRNVIESGTPYVSGEQSSVLDYDRTGTPHERIWNLVYQPVPNASGQVDAVMTCAFEVTEQVRTRTALATEKGKLKAIIDQSPAGLALIRGRNLTFEMVNAKWYELVSQREYVGKTYEEIYPELVGTPAHEALKEVFRTGAPFIAKEMKVRVEASPGVLEDRYYDFSYIQIVDGEGQPYGVFCHSLDVTERVRNRELRERFVAALSHDLRNPLAAAQSTAQMLLRHPERTDRVPIFASKIVSSISRADRMISDLLDASLIQVGQRLPIEIGPCDLRALVHDVAEEMILIHGDRFQVNATGSLTGHLSSSGIRRVLENLVNNAVKYGSPETAIKITLARAGEDVVLAVHNEGTPIPADEQEQLFEFFHRSQSATRSGKQGWGIGLTLARGITEAHGGTVRVESATEKGTTFSIRVPLDARHAVRRDSVA